MMGKRAVVSRQAKEQTDDVALKYLLRLNRVYSVWRSGPGSVSAISQSSVDDRYGSMEPK
jgi:hypothetical protein